MINKRVRVTLFLTHDRNFGHNHPCSLYPEGEAIYSLAHSPRDNREFPFLPLSLSLSFGRLLLLSSFFFSRLSSPVLIPCKMKRYRLTFFPCAHLLSSSTCHLFNLATVFTSLHLAPSFEATFLFFCLFFFFQLITVSRCFCFSFCSSEPFVTTKPGNEYGCSRSFFFFFIVHSYCSHMSVAFLSLDAHRNISFSPFSLSRTRIFLHFSLYPSL